MPVWSGPESPVSRHCPELKEQENGRNYRRIGERPARNHRRRHDGLQEGADRSNGDIQAAIDWLRKKGLSAAAKKSGRVAAEGLVGVALAPGKAAPWSKSMPRPISSPATRLSRISSRPPRKIALTTGDDVEALKAAAYPGTGRNVAEEIVHLVATIGENMTVRRVAVIDVPGGVAAAYIHGALKPGLGKIGVIVGLEGKPDEAIEALGKQIGMHVAAARPDALTIAEVDPAALEREKNALSEQARASGKPEAIIEKMVEGRVQEILRRRGAAGAGLGA